MISTITRSLRFSGQVVVLGLWLPIAGAIAEDKVISVPADDIEMNHAMAKARGSLPQFWADFANPLDGKDYFALKLKITDGENVEHFWCDQIERNEQATCVINNDAQSVATVKLGDRVTVEPDNISDWMIRKDGKIYGAQTLRVLLPKLDKAQADELRAVLADE
jgi:uncharacterized protein YegJ (DUF2314 family)